MQGGLLTRPRTGATSKFAASSADDVDALLGASFGLGGRLRRQLQNRGFLALAQEGQQEHVAIRQLQRIMMHVGLRLIDLPEDRSLVPRGPGRAIHTNFTIKSKLGARQYAHRRGGVTRPGKSTRPGAKVGCSQILANLRRS